MAARPSWPDEGEVIPWGEKKRWAPSSLAKRKGEKKEHKKKSRSTLHLTEGAVFLSGHAYKKRQSARGGGRPSCPPSSPEEKRKIEEMDRLPQHQKGKKRGGGEKERKSIMTSRTKIAQGRRGG